MTFTKTYNDQPNEAQKAAMSRAFKVTANYLLSTEKKDVEIVVDSFQGEKIVAKLIADKVEIEVRIIGVNGGLTLV